ncbi:HEAT repeat domain-containing protein [Paenibacillus ginsengarvi]|uniref:HEAT repeat domain-containing protein n=1 Tax=Paenibacillus ginsengarvi TaxID=400777 RepID=A0A3B0CMJ7_9BACL|nr:HEAT repeat domain-containing protein [Paenibacillus ginsengarvi]RKN86180.1 HEAT repeat domain-containing protein [Paenibacillus ginsengarvi]
MTENASHIIVLAYILIALIVLVFVGLFGLRTRAIWFDRESRRYSLKHQDYFDYVKSHLHEEAPLGKPSGKLTKTELKVIQIKLFEWMEKIAGAERDKLTQLCRDLGLVELNMRRLRSEIHWTRLDAAHNLGVMQAKEAVPTLLELLDEESYGSPVFVIARAISKSALSEEELDRMVRSIAKFRKQSHRLVAEVLALSRIDNTAMLIRYLREQDDELMKIALTCLQNRAIPGARELLPPLVRASDPQLRLLAVQAFVGQAEQVTEGHMKELMRHGDVEIRLAVVDALGRIGQPYTIELLKTGMADADWQVRFNSARSLARMEDHGFRALCELASGSESEEADLAGDVLQEELAKGALNFDDFEQAMRHSRRLGIYRQFFDTLQTEMLPSSMALSLSKGDSA